MKEISFEEFKNRNGNKMAAVSAAERQFYDLGDDTLGVIGKYDEGDEVEFRASTLTPSAYYDGEYRVNDSRSERGRNTEDAIERSRSKVHEWLQAK